MFKQVKRHQRKRTQTGSSAFFCARPQATHLRIAGAFLIALLSCSYARGVVDKKPALQLQGVSIKAIDWSSRTAETELSVAIKNPGPALKVKDLRYRLKLNEKQAATGRYEKVIDLAGDSTTTVKLPCSVDLSAMPGVAWSVVAGGFEVHYELESEFSVPLFGFSPRIKSTIAGDLSLVRTVSGWTAQIKERIASK